MIAVTQSLLSDGFTHMLGVMVVASTAISGTTPAVSPTRYRYDSDTVRTVNTPLTSARYVAAAGELAVETEMQQSFDLSVGAANERLPNAVSHLDAKIREMCALQDGWKGRGSLAPTRPTINDAYTLASLLEAFGAGQIVVVGADSEGAISFEWSKDESIGTISVYGDGTFAFYSRTGDEVAFSDAEPIGILPPRLADALAA